jgi:hypothetical protein
VFRSGGGWQDQGLPPGPLGQTVQAVCARSLQHAVASARWGLFEWDGMSWAARTDGGLSSSLACAPTEVWARLDTRVLRSTTPGVWVELPPPTPALELARTRDGQVFVLGTDRSSLWRWGGP